MPTKCYGPNKGDECFFHSFIHLSRSSLRARFCSWLGDIVVNKTDKKFCPHGAHVLTEEFQITNMLVISLTCQIMTGAAERGYEVPKAETGLPATFPGPETYPLRISPRI